jgi:multidrug resistance efflux pump
MRPDSSHLVLRCALAAAASLTLTLAACNGEAPEPLVVSGRVEAHDVRIGSKIGGRVTDVHVAEGDRVTSGQIIVLLDEAEVSAQLEQARAAKRQATAQLDLLKAGSRDEDTSAAAAFVAARRADWQLRVKGSRPEEVRTAEAEVSRTRIALDLAQKELDRAETLRKSGAVEQRDLDMRHADFSTAQARYDAAAQQEALVKSGSRVEEIEAAKAALEKAEFDLERLRNGARPQEITAQAAAVEAAVANEQRIAAQLAESHILAPADGVVETLDLHPGDLVRAGETVAIVNLLTSLYVRCYVPENRLANVTIGLPVGVTIDAPDSKIFHGRVRHVSAQGEFTPRNVQSTEKRSELVFETKVDMTDGTETLRAGMYADVHFEAINLRD